ncbi:hypothetical protein HBI56_020590 [Parastagonospora nodorum]|nr:hypothetical protein HBH56_173560 [Parastagonospora nodorum]KAH3926272.1 hypothetical protein HBH54_169540 [Parastagonospora nodorum]KAH3955811.1 hypothetical protein HBH53_002160 [Parastagonospora nodorum]KAH3971311.1 hypothetical protein HBH51_111720 [Parastagonospora nodorum]KAH3982538.1 hypothetical protein HBH52_075000 [Parastagonospora nodorum]
MVELASARYKHMCGAWGRWPAPWHLLSFPAREGLRSAHIPIRYISPLFLSLTYFFDPGLRLPGFDTIQSLSTSHSLTPRSLPPFGTIILFTQLPTHSRRTDLESY